MRTLLLSMVMLGVCVAVAHPDSALFNYQGRLLDDGGQPVNQAVTVCINICTSLTSAAEYAEEVGSVIVQNGLFTFSYGTNSPAIRQVLSGKEGWLELVIDGTPLAPRQRLHSAAFAMSLDENSLVQSTKFLLDMIAKHELEIQALRANSGLANTSGGNQYFVETFPDANGLNDLIDTASTTAIYNPTNQLYVAGDAGAARVITVSNAWYSTSCWSVAWYVTNINDSVQTVNGDIAFDGEGTPTNPVVFVWQYGTGVSLTNSPIILCTNGMRQSFAVTNPNPEGFVTQLKMGMPDSVPGCWEPYLMEIYATVHSRRRERPPHLGRGAPHPLGYKPMFLCNPLRE